MSISSIFYIFYNLFIHKTIYFIKYGMKKVKETKKNVYTQERDKKGEFSFYFGKFPRLKR